MTRFSLLVCLFFLCGCTTDDAVPPSDQAEVAPSEEMTPAEQVPSTRESAPLVNEPAEPEEETHPSKLTQEQQRALENLLTQNPGWRRATREEDSNLATSPRYQPEYDPYFAEADLNMDGQADFAVVLKQGDEFAAYWFPAREGGYEPARFLFRTSRFNRSEGLFASEGQLLVGEYGTDVINLEYRWNPETQELEEAEYTEDWE